MRRLINVAVALLGLVVGDAASGDAYPNRPVRLVLGFAPSGSADAIARVMASHLQHELGTNIVVDNRPGAGGTIAYDLVAKSAPDGYTLLAISSSFATSAVVYRKLPYDARKDFATVTLFATGVPNVLVVNPAFPAKSLRDLLALAKNSEKPVTYGSPGIGSVQHFVAELFNLRAGVHLLHVPYKGQAPALNALLGGEVNLVFLQPPGGLELIRSGKLRALAFAGSSRWPLLPDVPTAAESGVPEFHLRGPFEGILAPARIPKEIKAKLHSTVRNALEAPKLRDFFRTAGWEPDGRGPEEFRVFLDTEIKRLEVIARAAGIKAE